MTYTNDSLSKSSFGSPFKTASITDNIKPIFIHIQYIIHLDK